MTLTETAIRQIRLLIRPVKIRLANAIASAVVQNVDDSKKIQLLQLGVLDGEDVDDCQRMQEFGINSVPLDGAEAVVIFPNGDRGNGYVVCLGDRRHRPEGWAKGEAGTFNAFSAVMHHKADGTTEVTGGGVAVRLATKADIDALTATVNANNTIFNAHVHPGVTTGGASTTPTVTPGSSAAAAAGTSKLKGE